MSEKFKGKYRIESTRLQNWDYGWNGLYFITICTQNREHYFGDVVVESRLIATPQPHPKPSQPQFIASPLGEIAQKYWMEIPQHFPFVKLDAFVVMPNHVHGIIVIDKPDGGNARDAINRVSTGGITGHKNPMLNENVSRIIR